MCKLFAAITEEQGEVGKDLTGMSSWLCRWWGPQSQAAQQSCRDLFLRDSLWLGYRPHQRTLHSFYNVAPGLGVSHPSWLALGAVSLDLIQGALVGLLPLSNARALLFWTAGTPCCHSLQSGKNYFLMLPGFSARVTKWNMSFTLLLNDWEPVY